MVTAINRHARSKLSILSIVRKRYFPLSLFKIFEKIERNRSSFITFRCYPALAFIYAYMYIYIYTRKCKSRIKTNGSYSRIESIPIVKWNQNTGRVQSECNQIFNHIELYILFKISYRVGPVRTYFKNTRLYRADPPKNLLHRPRNNDVRDPPYLCNQMHNARGVIVVTQTLEHSVRHGCVYRWINDSIARTLLFSVSKAQWPRMLTVSNFSHFFRLT